jgi:Na+-transporting NADH:ubiquinone oxidoreductase subunit NqrF
MKNKCSEATEPNEVPIVVQPIEATKPNEIPIVVHAVLSGYITTLKNKQKLNVSSEGPSFN